MKSSVSNQHKTFLKASRWVYSVYSRAATGRGAGRAGCRFARARVRAEWLCQQQQAPPHMMTGQSIRTCLRREVPTDHEGPEPYAAGTAADALSNRASAGLQPGGRSGRVHDRGKLSRAKPDERCRTPFAVQTVEAQTPTTRQFQRRAKVDHTWHGGIHDHADDKVANRALGSLISTHNAWRGRSLPQSGAGVSKTTRST